MDVDPRKDKKKDKKTERETRNSSSNSSLEIYAFTSCDLIFLLIAALQDSIIKSPRRFDSFYQAERDSDRAPCLS